MDRFLDEVSRIFKDERFEERPRTVITDGLGLRSFHRKVVSTIWWVVGDASEPKGPRSKDRIVKVALALAPGEQRFGVQYRFRSIEALRRELGHSVADLEQRTASDTDLQCRKCGGWMMLIEDIAPAPKYKPFLGCMNRCGWKIQEGVIEK